MIASVDRGGSGHNRRLRHVLARADGWLLAPAPAERLAVLRLAVGGYSLIYIVANIGEFSRLAGRPAAEFEPIGLAGLLGGPVAPAVLWLLFAALIVSGACFTAGLRFRVFGPTFAACMLAWATYHSSWGQMLHFEHVVTLHLLVLGFSPAAQVLSVDGHKRTTEPAPSTSFGWPVRLLAIITVVTYALAGVAKLRVGGAAWLDGSTLANHIAYSATRLDLLGEPRPPLSSFVVGQEWLLQPMAVLGLGVELLAPLALISRRFRQIWLPMIVLFHLGTLTTMFVFFPYNGLGIALLPLVKAERLPLVRALIRRVRW